MKVKSVHGATKPGTVGDREGLFERPLPYTLDEMYSPGVGWHGSFAERDADGMPVQTTFTSAPRSFTRTGAAGGLFEVPAGKAAYRLHIESTRDCALSSKVVADFTFTSDTVPGELYEPLPLMTVRFTPQLDEFSRASRVIPAIVPVSVGHNTKAAARPARVEVSHDKGATWRPVPLVSFAGKWYTVIGHPRDAASVSLRASARDSAGNSVSQTIIEAFRLT
ncbi:hypothetical protein [Kibdelosporangium persicum]|uniref:hypothetical protein n=1 Tax=Kibdelosporangium persicum TaxID=2698649 RepID=UPI00156733D1|nr:hypothetical protein [Kibdelosporangium persicum]